MIVVKVNLICIGKIKEQYFTDGINEYKKRLSKYCNLNIIELQEYSSNDINKNIALESEEIIKKAKGELVLFDIKGSIISSEDLSGMISKNKNFGGGEISFIIGGSNGVSDKLKGLCNKISFGRVTFPHQLMRVIALEQIYRGFTIIAKSPYHK